MRLKRRRTRGVPGLNTAALPDLIFTVLFFFMIVTHMRKTDVKVQYNVPNGTELQELHKKHAITYIYIGKDKNGKEQVQLNNDVISVAALGDAVREERGKLPLDEQDFHVVSIKADKGTSLGMIADVKEALRQANALSVSYSANENKNQNKNNKE